MKKPDNIYVSLLLRKDPAAEGMLLDVHFTKEAPNFTIDTQDTACWSPTIEELDFIAQVFDLVAKNKRESKTHSSDAPPATREVDESMLLERVMEKKSGRLFTNDP